MVSYYGEYRMESEAEDWRDGALLTFDKGHEGGFKPMKAWPMRCQLPEGGAHGLKPFFRHIVQQDFKVFSLGFWFASVSSITINF